MTSFNLLLPRTGLHIAPTWLPSVQRAAVRLAVTLLIGLGPLSAQAANPPGTKAPPSPKQLKAFVLAFYGSQPGYQPGDIISRSSVEKLFVQLKQRGLTIQDPESILERILPDNDILVQQLQTKKGRAFWKKIHELPGGIDRLDRLARMPQGRANVRDLIQKIPDGYKWIEGMTTTRRGQRMGDRISKSESGRNFNKPTRRIYTAEELAEELSSVVARRQRQPAPAR